MSGVAQREGEGTPALVAGALVAGRYRLDERLGQGGMGVVWRAVHVVTRKSVALKFLRRDASTVATQRFLREARAACAVRHPCVVEVYDVLETDHGAPVMVMELLDGETLAARLTRERPMPLAELARIVAQVCSAVGSAHAVGIVHRDLKPENIFLVQKGEGIAVKVLDFGIAKLTASEGDAASTGERTATGAILGTPYYMAPEQLFGEKDIDHRADIWALGIIMYEALAGVRPTDAENIGQVYKRVMTEGIVPLRNVAPSLPEPVLGLVERMLAQDRAKRPEDLREVLAAVSEYAKDDVPPIDAPSRVVPSRPRTIASGSPTEVDSENQRASTTDACVSEENVSRTVLDTPRSDAVDAPRSRRSRSPWIAVAVLGVVAAASVSVSRGWGPWSGRSTIAPAGSFSIPSMKPSPVETASGATSSAISPANAALPEVDAPSALPRQSSPPVSSSSTRPRARIVTTGGPVPAPSAPPSTTTIMRGTDEAADAVQTNPSAPLPAPTGSVQDLGGYR